MALITTVDRNSLFLKVKHELGYPFRPFELTDEMMISYLEMVVEDYSALVNSLVNTTTMGNIGWYE